MKKKCFSLIVIITISTGLNKAIAEVILLSGIVPSNMKARIKYERVSSSLDLNSSQTDLKIATIKENTNSKEGYKFSITSANHGTFVANDALVSRKSAHPYTFKYNGEVINLTGDSEERMYSAKNMGKDKELSISFDASIEFTESSYSDIVHLNYMAN